MSVSKHIDEKLGVEVQTQGSDGRENTSSRGASRFSYNSRDEGQAYSLVFDDAACSSGDFNVVLINDRGEDYDMVIKSAAVNSVGNDSVFKLHETVLDAVAGGGAVVATPYRFNRSGSSNKAKVNAHTVVDSDTTPITGIISLFEIDTVNVKGGGHEEFRLDDALRYGEGQGVTIETETTTAGTRVHGVIFFYFEKRNKK